MKIHTKTLIPLFLLLFLSSDAQSSNHQNDRPNKEEVSSSEINSSTRIVKNKEANKSVQGLNKAQGLYQQFCDAYKDRDMAKLLSLFTKKATMIGAAADERCVGIKEIEAKFKRDWSQSQAGEIRIVNFLPSADTAMWASAFSEATITLDGKDHHMADLRATVSIEKENDIWKIAHMHGSFPDFRAPKGSSFPIEGPSE